MAKSAQCRDATNNDNKAGITQQKLHSCQKSPEIKITHHPCDQATAGDMQYRMLP